jgi:hypothetical protein
VNILPNGVKKWLMLQVWRVQQIAAILSLIMLAVTDALLIYDKVSWRQGIFSTPYTGGLMILIGIGLLIWGASIVWDRKLKMWREQMTVLVEKNPYNKERMASKEIVMYNLMWLPMLEHIGKQDPEVKAAAEALRGWMKRVADDDPLVKKDIEEILEFMGKGGSGLVKLDKK